MALPFKVSTTQSAKFDDADPAGNPHKDHFWLTERIRMKERQGEFNAFAPAETERDGQLGTPTYSDAELDAIIAARNENLRAKEAEQAKPAQQFSAQPAQQRSNGRRRYGRELAIEVAALARQQRSEGGGAVAMTRLARSR